MVSLFLKKQKLTNNTAEEGKKSRDRAHNRTLGKMSVRKKHP